MLDASEFASHLLWPTEFSREDITVGRRLLLGAFLAEWTGGELSRYELVSLKLLRTVIDNSSTNVQTEV